MVKRKKVVFTIKKEDIPKPRKEAVRPTQIMQDATKYTRKEKHKKAHLDHEMGLFVKKNRWVRLDQLSFEIIH